MPLAESLKLPTTCTIFSRKGMSTAGLLQHTPSKGCSLGPRTLLIQASLRLRLRLRWQHGPVIGSTAPHAIVCGPLHHTIACGARHCVFMPRAMEPIARRLKMSTGHVSQSGSCPAVIPLNTTFQLIVEHAREPGAVFGGITDPSSDGPHDLSALDLFPPLVHRRFGRDLGDSRTTKHIMPVIAFHLISRPRGRGVVDGTLPQEDDHITTPCTSSAAQSAQWGGRGTALA